MKRTMALGLAVAAFLVGIQNYKPGKAKAVDTAEAGTPMTKPVISASVMAPNMGNTKAGVTKTAVPGPIKTSDQAKTAESDMTDSQSENILFEETDDAKNAEDTVDKPAHSVENIKSAFNRLNFSDNGFDWKNDWWKYLALALGSLMTVYFGIRLTKMLFRFVLFVLCVGAGVCGAIFLEPVLSPIIENHIPERLSGMVTSQHAGYVIGFLAFYLLASIIIGILPKRFRDGI